MSIILSYYFHVLLEQLKSNIKTNFHFQMVFRFLTVRGIYMAAYSGCHVG